MTNYLKMADKQRILALLELGWSYRRIAREIGACRETVARYDPRRLPKPARVSTGPQSAAEPYRTFIEVPMCRDGLTAQRIWQDLVADYGFGYGYACIKRFARRVKRSHPEVADVLAHPPGQEAQVDFFRGPRALDRQSGQWRLPWILRVTLSCSRHSYEEPMWSADRPSFLRALENSFWDFGGVPATVRHDNLKLAVVRACLYDPAISEVYAAFAHHWGFVPLPSSPRHPQEQGITERGGGYMKDNALKGRRFDSLEELDSFLKHWNRTVARVRIHGTTRKQVYAHFLEVEKPALAPLPKDRFNLFEVGTRTVHPDGHVQVEWAFYSVPHTLVGEDVKVQWDDHLVRVYAQGQCVAVHSRAPVGGFATRQEHRPVHKPARQEAYEANLLAKAEHIGPRALAWAKSATEQRAGTLWVVPTGSSRAWCLSLVAIPRRRWTGHVVSRWNEACSATPCSGVWWSRLLLIRPFLSSVKSIPSYATCKSTPRRSRHDPRPGPETKTPAPLGYGRCPASS
ncbi:MAG: IS21 family transposase [Chloroflexi bacterium]|nr:IS21 family transposase [Chloroflexota bacterium]